MTPSEPELLMQMHVPHVRENRCFAHCRQPPPSADLTPPPQFQSCVLNFRFPWTPSWGSPFCPVLHLLASFPSREPFSPTSKTQLLSKVPLKCCFLGIHLSVPLPGWARQQLTAPLSTSSGTFSQVHLPCQSVFPLCSSLGSKE